MTRERLRRLRLGMATLLGRPQGFFIPYRYAGGVIDAGYPQLEPFFADHADVFRGMLAELDRLSGDLSRIGADPPPAPRWNQDWYPRLDAAVAYAVVRRFRPARILEAGSGHSTRFMARAVADGQLGTEIVAVDPAPRADIAGLPAVRVVPRRLDQARGELSAIGPGDVLFVDSSHILMPGSDVDIVLNQAIPELPSGALLHLHDIFLPDPYPADWGWRGYNEQCGVAPLLHGGGFQLLFASRYVALRLADDVARSFVGSIPLPAGAFEASLWLRKR